MIALWWVLVVLGVAMGSFFAAVFISQRASLRYAESLLHAVTYYAIAVIAAIAATTNLARAWGGYAIAALFAVELMLRFLPSPNGRWREGG